MKFLVILSLVTTFVVAETKVKKPKQVSKPKQTTIKKAEVHPALKDKEDCDDKAKKPKEIVPESISLTGNAGCTLE